MEHIAILEFPSNLGLKEREKGVEPGVKKLPDWLRLHGLYEWLRPEIVYRADPPPYGMHLDEESHVRNADGIAYYAIKQANLLTKALDESKFPVVIGGDCSILVGNALALRKRGNFGLFFLDGHTDYMWPPFSQTGGAAGMDLAMVTGHGHSKLTNIDQLSPYFKEENTWCVGNREYTDWYVKLIRDSKISYTDLAQLRKKGPRKTAEAFLLMVQNKNLDGFWLHFDVDVLNNVIMPAVDSPQEDGLSYEELNEILQPLFADTRLVGLDITILDPDLDPGGKHTAEFVQKFGETFARYTAAKIG